MDSLNKLKFSNSLRLKAIIAVFALLLLSSSLITWLNYLNARQQILGTMNMSASQTVKINAYQLSAWVQTRLAEMTVMANTKEVKSMNFTTGMAYLNQEYERLNNFYSNIGLCDTNGKIMVQDGKGGTTSIDIHTEESFPKIIRGESVISDPFVNQIDESREIITVGVPVKDENENVVGLVSGACNIDTVFDANTKFHFLKTDEVFIIDKQGLVLKHPQKNMELKYNMLKDGDEVYRNAIKNLINLKSASQSITVHGEDRILFAEAVPATDWLIVLDVPVKEYTSSLNKMLMVAFGTTLGFVILIVILVIIFLKRLDSANISLLRSNEELERKVSLRTQELTATNEELIVMNEEILKANDKLNAEIDRSYQLQQEVQAKNSELSIALENLKSTQSYLIQSEKMASLGVLVAGITHEINTPIGVSITAASHFTELSKDLKNEFKAGFLDNQMIEEYLADMVEVSSIIQSNLRRASGLIQSFKQVSADQSSEEQRTFNVKSYIGEIIFSLQPKLKKTKIQIEVICEDNIDINSFPGAFSQILTNLIINSLIHAFDSASKGKIVIQAEKADNWLLLQYSDNGNGINSEVQPKIFDPFFTTNRGNGGTGLGLYILYTLIAQKFGGTIDCESTPEKGTKFNIKLNIGG
jgi:signal transduction histidine kinase